MFAAAAAVVVEVVVLVAVVVVVVIIVVVVIGAVAISLTNASFKSSIDDGDARKIPLVLLLAL